MQKYVKFKKYKDYYENTTFDIAFFIECLGFVCSFLSLPFFFFQLINNRNLFLKCSVG